MGESRGAPAPVLDHHAGREPDRSGGGAHNAAAPGKGGRDWFDRLFPFTFGYIALMLAACVAVFVWAARVPSSPESRLTPSVAAPAQGPVVTGEAGAAFQSPLIGTPAAAATSFATATAAAPTPSPSPAPTPVAAPAHAAVTATVALAPTLAAPPIVLSESAVAFTRGDAQELAPDPAGALALVPTLADDFAVPTGDAAQWRVVPWGAGGTASVHDGVATLTVAALRSQRPFVHRALVARVRFTGGSFQNVAWSADLNGPTAILIGVPASDPGHVYARVKEQGQTDRLVPLSIDPDAGEYHVYRIDWQADRVDFAVDGSVRANIAVSLDTPMFAWLSAASARPLDVDWARVEDYASVEGSYVSQPVDAGRQVAWETLRVRGTAPNGTQIAVHARTSSDGVVWSEYETVEEDGRVANPPGRYLQYAITVKGTATNSPTIAAIAITATPASSP